MKGRVLFRKQIQLLKTSKGYVKDNNFNKVAGLIRDAYVDLFYKTNELLRDEFVEILSPEEIGRARRLLDFSRSVSGKMGSEYTSSFRGIRFKQNNLIMEYDWLINKLETVINKKYRLKVFYSWQSDLPNFSNRTFIEDCLKKSIKAINDNYSMGLELDQDTRSVPGAPDIIDTILRKIENSYIYVADVSIVGKIYKMKKYTSNQNVMFELGYALSLLDEDKIILLCNTYVQSVKELPFDIGKKRLITYYLGDSNRINKPQIAKQITSTLYDAIECIANND